MLAPIILFVYNRPWHTKQTVEALQKNELASESELFIFADGPKDNANEEQHAEIKQIQDYIVTISGFKEVHIKKSTQNKGLANSIIEGVSAIINKYDKAIVIEDDIMTHPLFLRFMNDALDIYKNRDDIYMISGFSHKIRIPSHYKKDVYLIPRCCSWGWATWKDRWDKADWNINNYKILDLEDKGSIKRFNRCGKDLFEMLKMQKEGKIDSWAIRWQHCMYLNNGYTLMPIISFAKNIGFDGSGTHCSKVSTSNTKHSESTNKNNYRLILPPKIKKNNNIVRNFKKAVEQAPSLRERIKYFLRHFSHKKTKQSQTHFYDKYVDVDNSTIIDNPIKIRLDNPNNNGEKKYLVIGKDCIINGSFIFESKEGFVSIGNHSYIGASTFICRSSITVGCNVTIAWGCTIYDHDSHSLNYLDRRKDIDDELSDIRNGKNFILNKDWSKVNSKPIVIKDDAWIGMNCIILKGVTIGKGAVVGAGSVVTKDVPDWTVVAGNPAMPVKTIS